jgi:hypothetical protein
MTLAQPRDCKPDDAQAIGFGVFPSEKPIRVSLFLLVPDKMMLIHQVLLSVRAG